MRYSDVDLFGVYVAPISIMLVAAWMIVMVLRRIANRVPLARRAWHPALFEAAVYIIVLSSIVLLISR